MHALVMSFLFQLRIISRSQWPRDVWHELSSPARTLGSWVQIPPKAWIFRRWLPTAAARVHVRAACGVCGRQSGTGAGFLRVLQFPLPIIPPISPLS
jgi:hypothetical protein